MCAGGREISGDCSAVTKFEQSRRYVTESLLSRHPVFTWQAGARQAPPGAPKRLACALGLPRVRSLRATLKLDSAHIVGMFAFRGPMPWDGLRMVVAQGVKSSSLPLSSCILAGFPGIGWGRLVDNRCKAGKSASGDFGSQTLHQVLSGQKASRPMGRKALSWFQLLSSARLQARHASLQANLAGLQAVPRAGRLVSVQCCKGQRLRSTRVSLSGWYTI